MMQPGVSSVTQPSLVAAFAVLRLPGGEMAAQKPAFGEGRGAGGCRDGEGGVGLSVLGEGKKGALALRGAASVLVLNSTRMRVEMCTFSL